jgi:hypothetical protein
MIWTSLARELLPEEIGGFPSHSQKDMRVRRTKRYHHRNIPMILKECRRFLYLYGNAAKLF